MDSHILIVDDDPDIRESMHEYIEKSGFVAFSVSSAEEALELLKKAEIKMVITDIILPGKNGLELTGLVKKDYDIDVIVMTGHNDNYSYEEAIEEYYRNSRFLVTLDLNKSWKFW